MSASDTHPNALPPDFFSVQIDGWRALFRLQRSMERLRLVCDALSLFSQPSIPKSENPSPSGLPSDSNTQREEYDGHEVRTT